MPKDSDRKNGLRHARLFASDLRTRTENDSEELYIEGYFAVYNSVYSYEIWGVRCEEVILPGAFADVLSDDVRALTNHDTSQVLGRTSAGTLTLREDARGLWGSVRINPGDRCALDLYARVQRGDVDQCSFGFDGGSTVERRIPKEDGTVRWEIEKITKLYEVSVCTFPAYEDTGVSAREAEIREIKSRELDAWREAQRRKLHPLPVGGGGT